MIDDVRGFSLHFNDNKTVSLILKALSLLYDCSHYCEGVFLSCVLDLN